MIPVAMRTLWSVLWPEERNKAWVLIVFVFVGTLLEMASLGLVLPFAAYLLDPGSVGAGWLRFLPSGLASERIDASVAVSLALALVAAYLIKTLFLSFLAFYQTGFSYAVQERIAAQLFGYYLSQPYEFHLRRNSASLIRNIVTETSMISSNILTPAIMLVSELLVLVGMLLLVFLVNPLGTVVVAALLGGFAVFVVALTKRLLGNLGARRQFHEGKRVQEIQQALGGIREVIVFQSGRMLRNRFSVHNHGSLEALRKFAAIQLLPKYWIELAGIVGLVVLLVVVLVQGQSGPAAFAGFALYAAVAFRTLPSFNRIVSATQALRFGMPSVLLVADELRQTGNCIAESPNDSGRFAEGHIVAKGLSFGYADGTNVFDGIDFDIRPREAVGIRGESGAGKSTLLGVLLGLLRPVKGSLTCGGVEISDAPNMWHRHIGYVPQSVYLNDDSLSRNIAFGIEDDEIDRGRVMEVLEAVRLGSWVRSLEQGIDTLLGECGARVSGGQRQRIGIARALYREPSLLVLDEPTSALDPQTEKEVLEVVSTLKGRVTLVVVSHTRAALAICDRLWFLEGGNLQELMPGHSEWSPVSG